MRGITSLSVGKVSKIIYIEWGGANPLMIHCDYDDFGT